MEFWRDQGIFYEQVTNQILDDLVAEATEAWGRVFDAVVGRLPASERRAAARESLNEVRRLLRARPEQRYDILGRTVMARRSVFAGTIGSVESLRVLRTMLGGR